MHYKNLRKNTKKYLKFNLLTFLVLSILIYPSIFVQKVNAEFEISSSPLAHEVYNLAWKTINEKFYFKSKLHLDNLKNKFEKRINDLNDAHKYINKLIKGLNDPYTRFLTKEEFKDEQDIINSAFVGIGVKLSNKKPIVLEVLPESSASKEDLKPNDYIVKVNNQNTYYLNTNEIVNLLRGEKDSTLTIQIKRGKEILTKTLKRKELHFNAVTSQLLDNDIALVKIDSFIPENTSRLFKDQITKLMSAKGLIIDLRNNSGGLLKNAIEIADMFLTEGKIVTTVYNTNNINEYANSSKLFDSNVIILVNENTASASEILASALKENNRAIVIGEKTFGKGLVQEIVKLPDDSALHVTIAAYLTPGGNYINKVGLIPDEIVSNENKQLERAKEILVTLL